MDRNMSNNTIYLGNKSDLNKGFDIKFSGNENDFSNTSLVSDGKNLTIRDYGFIEKQGLVIFLDALGMKGIWKRFPPIEVVQKWSNVNTVFLSIEEPEVQNLDFSFRALSDTIIITISNIDSLNINLPKIFDLLIKPFLNSIKNKILLRGVITFGPFYWSDKLIIGPAIDEAAEYHNKVNWIGISTSPLLKLNLKIKKNDSLLLYKIPYKEQEKFYDGIVLNWPIYDTNNEYISILMDEESKAEYNSKIKYKNTYTFYNYCKKMSKI
jgi:hypothetical protein